MSDFGGGFNDYSDGKSSCRPDVYQKISSMESEMSDMRSEIRNLKRIVEKLQNDIRNIDLEKSRKPGY